jgi:hypothetical protein
MEVFKTLHAQTPHKMVICKTEGTLMTEYINIKIIHVHYMKFLGPGFQIT